MKEPMLIRRGRFFRQACGLLLTLSVLLAGCLSHPRLETVLYDRAGTVVSLKEFPAASVQASHPVALDPRLVGRVLAGLHVREHQTIVESSLTGEARSVRVFTPSQIDLLAPLLAKALNRATAVEQVRFRVQASDSGTRVTLAGILYLTEGDVNLSLTHYGRTPQRPSTLSQPSRSFDRPKRWSLTFVPEEAAVNRGAEPLVPADAGEPNVLVINLRVLESTAPAVDEVEKERAAKREPAPAPVAGEAIQKELRRLDRTLEEQEERLERMEQLLQER